MPKVVAVAWFDGELVVVPMLLANSVVGIKSPTEVSCVLVVAAVTALLVDSLTRELSVPLLQSRSSCC